MSIDDGIQSLLNFPVFSAIQGRRSRRFGVGMEIPDGPLKYKSTKTPQPLSDLERSILTFAATGMTGLITGMEHTVIGGKDELCSYPVRLTGRANPSAAGIGASELLVTDESGTYITQLRKNNSVDGMVISKNTSLYDLPRMLDSQIVRLSDSRIEIPRKIPMMSAHNVWNANVPGSTLFVPVVDLSEILLNFLFIYMQSGFTPWDLNHGRPCGNFSVAVQEGILDPEKRFSIQEFEMYILTCGSVEMGTTAHNAVLTLQAMGLGGWMFSGIDPGALLGSQASAGIPGAGFTFSLPKDGSSPSNVGLESYMEAYTPPWYATMDEAVDAFIERKYGVKGTYSVDSDSPWKDENIKKRAEKYPIELINAVKAVATYLYETYGRFPGTIPAVYSRMYTQAHHVDEDFYDEFYEADYMLTTHRDHQNNWHPQ